MPLSHHPGFEPTWFKSSYSGANTTECVETAFVPAGVLVRDSKSPGGPRVAVSAEAWQRFVGVSGLCDAGS
ncbi:DUF397 domain-containing protein [Streptomyces sp. NPDC014882]|uniref:DUF397 domain-containing protein n=1 Tax=Streptomyces sp. NPDC014882 TaxID=3364927 RepID=UPI0036F63E0F